jgi:hypothetical protein
MIQPNFKTVTVCPRLKRRDKSIFDEADYSAGTRFLSSLQKASFNPNWICLDGPAEKTFPNCAESAVALGKSKFG